MYGAFAEQVLYARRVHSGSEKSIQLQVRTGFFQFQEHRGTCLSLEIHAFSIFQWETLIPKHCKGGKGRMFNIIQHSWTVHEGATLPSLFSCHLHQVRGAGRFAAKIVGPQNGWFAFYTFLCASNILKNLKTWLKYDFVDPLLAQFWPYLTCLETPFD